LFRKGEKMKYSKKIDCKDNKIVVYYK